MKDHSLKNPDAEVLAYRELREQISNSSAPKELKRGALAMLGQTFDTSEALAVWTVFERIRTHESEAQKARRMAGANSLVTYRDDDGNVIPAYSTQPDRYKTVQGIDGYHRQEKSE